MDDALVRALFAPFGQLHERPFVVAQLGQSLDGRIATITGASRSIGGAAALTHLHRLRVHVDAVVVGIGTVLADDPQLTVRLASGRSPARVVIDPSGRLPATARCLDGGCFVVCRPGTILPDSALPIRLDQPEGMISPQSIVEALFARGFRRLLIEGGARTISNFIDAGCVDRLHVAVAPMIIGSGKPGLELRPIETLSQALRPSTTAYILEDGNVLFDCDLRHKAVGLRNNTAPGCVDCPGAGAAPKKDYAMQSSSNPPQTYAASQKWLHWLVAAVVLFMLPVGYLMIRLPDGSLPDRLFDLHRSFGLVVLALAILRLAVRTARGAPAPYAGLTGFERIASTAAHHLLYVLIFLMPLLGWAAESAFGGNWSFFGLFDTPHILPADRPLSDILSRIHDWTALVLAAVLVAHVGGALMHAVIKRDGVMARMLPGG